MATAPTTQAPTIVALIKQLKTIKTADTWTAANCGEGHASFFVFNKDGKLLAEIRNKE